jgi:hypothetical protein
MIFDTIDYVVSAEIAKIKRCEESKLGYYTVYSGR